MLDKLFGTKLKIKLIGLFLSKPDKEFSAAEAAKAAGGQVAAAVKELKVLEKLGLLNQSAPNGWRVNADFILYPELRGLVLKGKLLLERSLIKKIEKTGHLKLLLLTGKFMGLPYMPTDILLVGQIRRESLSRLIKKHERDLGQEINYTIMSEQEFKYRKDITDKFLYDILENKSLRVIDKL